MSLTYYTQIYLDCKIRVVIRPVEQYATQISRFSNGKVAKNMIKYYGLFYTYDFSFTRKNIKN